MKRFSDNSTNPPAAGPGIRPACRRKASTIRKLLLGTLLLSSLAGLPAQAADGLLQPGDAVVSGFSGIRPSGRPLAPGANPLDGFFIDTEGPAAQILSLSGLGGVPAGQLVPPLFKRQIKASEVGQVFAIALDEGQGSGTPNFYLGATSAYGIQIVGPDNDGDGLPNRLRNGQPGAQFMAGQFGPGGDAGTLWRVDGVSGAVSRFASLPGNSGPGIGDIAFDRNSRSFYVSDLDSGLIQRLDGNGALLDSFDHGQSGRPVRGLPVVADDGMRMDIANPAFDSENPATWGYTPPERRVHGLAVRDGRLFYAVAAGRQVWSVGLNPDGSFAGDARWELDASGLAGDGPLTDMLFDTQGRLYLAQRGGQRGSYDYSVYAEPGRSTLLRYRLEQPDDPATPSRWLSDAESYAIGLTPPHHNANGGIALGHPSSGAAGDLLWSTGERLRASEEIVPAAAADVHGLQGNGTELVRPANEPPMQSYFVDYDGLFNDPEKAGHLGDVEIVPGQPLPLGSTGYYGWEPPPWGTLPPVDLPPDGDEPGYDLNLRLTKQAMWPNCIDEGGVVWVCSYEVRVRNTSDTHHFFGLIRVQDHLPIVPPGAIIGVLEAGGAPWLCGLVAAPNTLACQRDAFLPPNASVAFHVIVLIPKASAEAAHLCHLSNIAEITHPMGGSWQNSDPFDDVDAATAVIPAPYCNPPMQQANLRIEKEANPAECQTTGGGFLCHFRIRVWNAGPGVFDHQLTVREQLPAGVIPGFSPGGDWNCDPGFNSACTHLTNPLHLRPGQDVFLFVSARVPFDVARANNCRIRNRVQIHTPPGGHPMNTNPADDRAEAEALIPGQFCAQILPVQKQECPPGYRLEGGSCAPITRTPPPPPSVCPPGTYGKWPNCQCPTGTTGTPPNCVRTPTPQPCPQGSVGSVWPNCRCPTGYRGTPPNCVRTPTTQPCPQGSVGSVWPNCHCPKGTTGTPPNCVRIIIDQCRQGTVGKWPDCRTCPTGTIARGNQCVTDTGPGGGIRPCPQGQVGTPPNCRTCPTGTIPLGNQCIRRPTLDPSRGSAPVICKPGQIRRGNSCEPILNVNPPQTNPARCTRDQVRVGNRCIPRLTNPTGTTPIQCPKGQVRLGNSCVPRLNLNLPRATPSLGTQRASPTSNLGSLGTLPGTLKPSGKQ